jgi:hypothetical protein
MTDAGAVATVSCIIGADELSITTGHHAVWTPSMANSGAAPRTVRRHYFRAAVPDEQLVQGTQERWQSG